jgi:hypothetical protein
MNLLLDHKLIDVVLESVLMYVLKVLVDFRLMLEAELVMLIVLVCLRHWHWGLLFSVSVALFNDNVLIFELILV